jgi:hypothetical protein
MKQLRRIQHYHFTVFIDIEMMEILTVAPETVRRLGFSRFHYDTTWIKLGSIF